MVRSGLVRCLVARRPLRRVGAGGLGPGGRDAGARVGRIAVPGRGARGGAIGYGLSITRWVKGARQLGAARGQVIFAAAPFVGAVISWTVLGEPIAVTQLVALVLAGTGALSLGTSHHHENRHEATDHEHEHRHDDGHHRHEHPEPAPLVHSHRHHHEALDHEYGHLPDLHHAHPHG